MTEVLARALKVRERMSIMVRTSCVAEVHAACCGEPHLEDLGTHLPHRTRTQVFVVVDLVEPQGKDQDPAAGPLHVYRGLSGFR